MNTDEHRSDAMPRCLFRFVTREVASAKLLWQVPFEESSNFAGHVTKPVKICQEALQTGSRLNQCGVRIGRYNSEGENVWVDSSNVLACWPWLC